MESLEPVGYDVFQFNAVSGRGDSLSHPVYFKGDGPAMLLLQEMPGIGPEMLRLSERFVAEDFKSFSHISLAHWVK